MGIWIGRHRKARSTYGFDDVALMPGTLTIDPNDVDTSFEIAGYKFKIPIIASAMDAIVDTNFAIEMGRNGCFAVLNLEGLYCKYDDATVCIDKIISDSKDTVTNTIQKIYQEPTKIKLIERRIKEIKEKGFVVAVSATPANVSEFGDVARRAGADIFVIQSTVTTVNHKSSSQKPLEFKKFIKNLGLPVIIGNTVNYDACLDLMEAGAEGVLIGIGPGAACTTREVLGIGLPQITATCDAAAARDFFYKKTGKYVSVITDGGMRGGGDICKAIASGADAVMLGSLFAKSKEAPGGGYHWGMATPSILLPRGTRIKVGIGSSLKKILFGPSASDNGTENLIGALKNSMGSCGAANIRQMQMCEMIVAPSMRMEGKAYQFSQHVGTGK